MAVEYALFTAEASGYHQDAYCTKADLFEPDVRALLEVGKLIYSTDYMRALRARELVKQGWRDLFDEPGVLRIRSVFEAATDFANRMRRLG